MDENIVYFQNILPQLKGIYLHEVWPNILRMIGRRIHSTCLCPSDWKDFAAEVGIREPLVLEDIEISAVTSKELPLCVAFCGPLQYNYTLYDIIQALITLQRADILCLIREEFEDFWNEQREKMLQRSAHASSHSNCAVTGSVLKAELPKSDQSLPDKSSCDCDEAQSNRNEIETFSQELAEMFRATNLECSRNEDKKSEKSNELTTEMESKDCSRAKESSPFDILYTLDHNTKLRDVPFIHCKPQKEKLTSDSKRVLKVDIPHLRSERYCPAVEQTNMSRLEGDKPKPGISNDPISVFIIYVACEIRTGIRLANMLREAGFRVITISEAECMIRIDRSGFLRALLQKVDFVIPVICDEYMQSVRPDRFQNLNSNDGRTNRFIFTWFHSEYENNACLNFRVKPVVVEDFNWYLIKNDPIFQWVHRLWDEVDALVQILHSTKQIMRTLTETWNQEEFVEQWMRFFNSD